MNWRLLIEDGVTAAAGLATDEMLASAVGELDAPPTLRLYTYRSHCVLVGRFQQAEHEVDLKTCHSLGIDVNRRPTGGGAILMGGDQLGVALAVPGRGTATTGRPRELMARFSRGLIRALESLGIRAAFRGKNDLEVEGRKLAGLGLHRAHRGGLLFHASLLVDLDVPLMLRVLRIPGGASDDKEIATRASRISTVRRELGRFIEINDVRTRVADGFATEFGVSLHAGELTAGESNAALRLELERYRRPDWVLEPSPVVNARGRASRRTAEGTLEVHVALAGGLLKAVALRGDFIAADDVVADLEARLRWHPAAAGAVAETVRTSLGRGGSGFGPILSETVTEVILAAVTHAVADTGKPDPYGCFVTPGAAGV